MYLVLCKPYHYLIPYMKINLKGIMDLEIKMKTIKLLEESIWENICDLIVDKKFLGRPQNFCYFKLLRLS